MTATRNLRPMTTQQRTIILALFALAAVLLLVLASRQSEPAGTVSAVMTTTGWGIGPGVPLGE